MAERFVSPGVFTRENDLSFLPQGIAEIGGAFIGPTVKGPAFVPTIVESADEFRTKFGNPNTAFYAPHAAMAYLQDAARATIVRVLGLGGFEQTEHNPIVVLATSASGLSPSSSVTLGVIIPTRNTEGVTPIALATDSSSIDPSGLDNTGSVDFDMQIENGNAITSSFTGLSVVPSSPSYWVKALGESPAGTKVGYAVLAFPRSVEAFGGAVTGAAASWSISLVSGSTSDAYAFALPGFVGDYSNAATPWIQSQTVGGQRHNLFKVHTFSDGNASNREIKVSVTSTKPAAPSAEDQHGVFSLAIRKFSDTDARQTILEQFDNLSLDPDSPKYIARVIGDTRFTVDSNGDLVESGEWPSLSRFVYVEMVAGIETLPDTILPSGFGPLNTPVGGDALTLGAGIPSASYVTTRYAVPVGGSEDDPVENIKIHYGFDYTDVTNLAFLNPIPASSSLDASSFSLEDIADNDVTASVTASTVTGGSLRKFTVPLQGGFDGLNPSRVLATQGDIAATNTQGFDLSLSTTSGSAAFKRAIDIVSNPEAFDINLVSLPGVLRELHPYVTQLVIDMCEDRGDCFYIMDNVGFGSSVDAAVNVVGGIDSNYAGVYHPWIKILDVNTNKNLWVTPSTVLPQVFAFSDKVAAEWFAPAGLNRGGITAALQVEKRLTKDDRDVLYDGRVNPIAMFPGTGIVAFGQKNLQARASALDRINVRRLLIAVKKFIASSARFLVFEQNVDSTRQRFLNIANPFLASIQERSGLYAFRVIMDEANNPPDLIDRNILVGQIYLQPTRTAEFITLEFNILPTGATFPEGA
jgi:phage tail sheath protein FI